MPGHKDPEYEILTDDKGFQYLKIIRDNDGKKVVAEPEPEEVKVDNESGPEELYDVDELYDMVKKEQVEILEKLGLSKSEIRKLNKEDKRVNKILELQGQ